MKRFGLIGKKLTHSFSKHYFTDKFNTLNLNDHSYELYELGEIKDVSKLFKSDEIIGLNVTVPYKESIIEYLDELDSSALKIGAVNVVHIKNGKLVGYNSDYSGFKNSLTNWLPTEFKGKALVLGSGGASKAVTAALIDLHIDFKIVSRKPADSFIEYNDTDQLIRSDFKLIINTTPLGMTPDTESAPTLNYNLLSNEHYLYDLVYNPGMTKFLKLGQDQGAIVKNGLEMLHLQAEESWRIWNSN